MRPPSAFDIAQPPPASPRRRRRIGAARIRRPSGQLACYQAKAATKAIAQAGCGAIDSDAAVKIEPRQEKHAKRLAIHLADQFGDGILDTKKEAALCLPAQVVLPSP